MLRQTAIFTIVFFLIIAASCSKSLNKKNNTQSQSPNPALEQSTDTAGGKTVKELRFADHSALDSLSGVFDGDWEETVGDITVRAAVRVRLQEGRITEITFTDSSHIHPTAARIIPQRIIESQRLPVESITGASVSSWTIMTAVAVALGIDLRSLEEK
jgi:uncharacterized protein with FMN-binding domain